MNDPRIPVYREAALAMTKGRFQVDIPIGNEDQVAQLGKALVDLRQTLEKRFSELTTLCKITEQINAGVVLDDVLNQVYETFQPIIPYDRIGLSLLENEGRQVRARWVRSESPATHLPIGYEAPLEGSSLQQIIDSGRPRILNDLEAYLEAHPQSHSTRLIVKEGVRSSLTCPLVAKGKPIGFLFFSSRERETYKDVHVGVFNQIAGQLSVIIEKGRLYQQLIELNDLKNKFLGMAAHDLRNPIAIIKGYSGLFLQDLLGAIPDSQRQLLEKIDKACETMLALINDLLDVSAIESGQLKLVAEETDLSQYLSEWHAMNRPLAAAKSIDLQLALQKPLPKVAIDPDRINQVINNLVTNAIKFSHPDTTVTLGAKAAESEVEIFVADQGQGIPQEEIPKVFKAFSRTSVKPTAGESSTGLGLAIVKKMVEAHGGRIWVESKIGAGSTFTFCLPILFES